jgi:NCS1 family nucleobase:cation symporter-1
LIADYWIVRRTNLRLEDLYLPDGAYRYTAGWNVAGTVATLAGCAAAWGGLVIAPLRPLYDYAWFVGLGVAALVYLALAKREQ